MSAVNKLHKEFYTKSQNIVTPIQFRWVKGELFYLCKVGDNQYQEIRDKDLFNEVHDIKDNRKSKKNKYKPISVETNGVSRTYYNTRHFKQFEEGNQISISQLRSMCDLEGLTSNVFEAEVELIKDWNKSNPEYKIFISPITFE